MWYDVDWIGNYFVHRPSVNDVLISFLWHQWNWQLMYTNATYWTLWYPPSYGKIWIGKFVIAQRIGRCGILFLMARFELANLSSTRRSWRCSFLPFLLSSNSIHTRLFIISYLKTVIWIVRMFSNYKKTKDEISRTSFRSRTTGSSLPIESLPKLSSVELLSSFQAAIPSVMCTSWWSRKS